MYLALCPHRAFAVRKVGYFGPVFPDGPGDQYTYRVPIHRAAGILTQSKDSDKEVKQTIFSNPNARLLSMGSVSAPGIFFITIPHVCQFLPPPHHTIRSAFLPYLRIWPILCTQLMMMAMLVVESGGTDILCC